MALNQFAFLAADNPTTEPSDGSMKTLIFEPVDYPQWELYGRSNRGSDGSIIYSAAPWFAVLFPGVLLNTGPTGSSASTGTVKDFYEEYRYCLNNTDGRMWVNRWNPETLSWQKTVARVQWADWSNKLSSRGAVNFVIEFMGVGITSIDYAGGEANPPDLDTGSNGEEPELPEEAGEFGVGLFGLGPYGIGQDIY